MQSRVFEINSIDKVKAVVNLAGNFAEDVNAGSGSYIVDCKSVLGVLSLDLSRPVKIAINTDDMEQGNKFFKAMEEICK